MNLYVAVYNWGEGVKMIQYGCKLGVKVLPESLWKTLIE
jgi:hypothetical protein